MSDRWIPTTAGGHATGATPPAFESEHAHDASAIEWWFVQGHYALGGRRRDFLATLFRANLADDDAPPRHGHQLLLAVLDEGQDRHRSTTWVDAGLVRGALERANRLDPHVDAAVQRATLAEIEASGPLRPVVLAPEAVRFTSSPLRAAWGEFELAQVGGRLSLRFREPGGGAHVALELEASAPLLDLRAEAHLGPPSEAFAHRTYPRARVRGVVGEEAVAGEAWFDHQWGSIGWFYDAKREHLLGWDWFGINLDDGSDWVVMRQRDVVTGEVLAMNATSRTAEGAFRQVTALEARPVRHWESPETHVRYPVVWQLEVPGLGATFAFQPDADAQELASFGALRAVWEGAGTVTGSVDGRPARGRARGEFHGYGYVLDFDDVLGVLAERVDRHLAALLPRRFDLAAVERYVGPALYEHEPEAFTATIATPVWDLIDRSGKRWRPIFGILLAEAFGIPYAPYERLGSVTSELLHTGALIVDDIQDGSALRRGQPSLHLRYGVDVALNAGNALYFLPAVELMQHPDLSPETRLRLHEIKERVCIEAHLGQATDIYWSRAMTPDRLARWLDGDIEAKILQMYALKTGAGAHGIAESVAVVGGVADPAKSAGMAFARAFAIAFQVTDDVLNFSRSPRWTKTRGEDVAGGKLTFVIATALRRLADADRARLAATLCSPTARADPERLREAIDLVQASGALEVCRERARAMLEEAWGAFAKQLPPSEPKVMLHALCLEVLDLAFDA